MPSSEVSTGMERSTYEQIEELKAKIALFEGDRKAYFESSQFAMKKNRDGISKLRIETKELRKRLRDKLSQDDHVILKAFHDRPVERAALSNKTGREAITIFDHKVCDRMKKVNATRHVTARKQKRLEELQTQYDQMVKDTSDAVNSDKGDSADAQTMRYLENSYDKVTTKVGEAEQVQRVYLDIKARFEKEAMAYPSKLDTVECEIRKVRGELKDLKAMHNDAQLSKESAMNKLRKQEDTVYAEKKKRDVELSKMKKEAEEKKIQHERIEKRLEQRAAQQTEYGSQDKNYQQGEDQQQKITTYEEGFKRIKEYTGVSDTMEVVFRFENQGATTKHLEEMKKENETSIMRLREDKEKLQQEFEEMKYSGEAKLSSGQTTLEEHQGYLSKEEARREQADDELQNSSRLLAHVKAGVEHLSDKLHHLKTIKEHVPATHISPSSDEYVLDQLSTSEEKLMKLLEGLDEKDMNELTRKMKEEEFHSSTAVRLPMYNTRIKLSTTEKDLVYGDEYEDSGDDESNVPNRGSIKKQSQFLVDSKTKRREPKKKKKTK